MKQLFVIAHTICETDIPALLDSLVKNTHSLNVFYPEKNL
jgi:hypothetical protein